MRIFAKDPPERVFLENVHSDGTALELWARAESAQGVSRAAGTFQEVRIQEERRFHPIFHRFESWVLRLANESLLRQARKRGLPKLLEIPD